jgi:uncharacterized protein (DUF4415 family)
MTKERTGGLKGDRNGPGRKKALQKHKPRDKATRRPTPEEVVEFMENYWQLMDPRARLPLKLISIKMDVPLLESFKLKAAREGIPYQTKIKQLMREWLEK